MEGLIYLAKWDIIAADPLGAQMEADKNEIMNGINNSNNSNNNNNKMCNALTKQS